jgi:hypothetical protein
MIVTTAVPAAAARRKIAPGFPPGRPAQRVDKSRVRTTGLKKLKVPGPPPRRRSEASGRRGERRSDARAENSSDVAAKVGTLANARRGRASEVQAEAAKIANPR